MMLKNAHDAPLDEVEGQGVEVADVAEQALLLALYQRIFQVR